MLVCSEQGLEADCRLFHMRILNTRSQWSEREQPSVKSNPTSNRRRGCVNVWTPERKTDHEASVECQPVDLSPGPELGQKSTFLVLYPRWQALMFT